MLDRRKRLNAVYEHLHNNHNIHTKGEFADSIKYARAYISSALNGNERYLTDNLFRNICDSFPGVFNLDYLLTGKGSLLQSENVKLYDASDRETLTAHETSFRPAPPPDVPQWADSLISIIANQVKENESIVKELRSCLLEVRVLRDEIAALRNNSQ